MITAEDYRKDPCGAFSLPYWKAKSIAIPTHMQIVREDQLDGTRLDAYMDDPYFKLCHYFDGVKKPMCPRGFELVLSTPELLSRHIAQCYEYERLSVSELQEMQSHFTYCPGLWISVADEASGEVAATGIAGI